MRSYWSRTSISFCLAVAILNLSSMVALASPEQTQTKLAGDLSVSGRVTVNGQETTSGASFFTDGQIATAENSNAIVSLGKIGRVQYLPNTTSTLSFGESGMSGSLDAGQAQISKPQGVSVAFNTKDGSVTADASTEAVFTIGVEKGNTFVSTTSGRVTMNNGTESREVSAGQDGTMGGNDDDNNRKRGGGGGVSQPALEALAAGLSGVFLAAVIIAMLRDDDKGNNGTQGPPIVIVPSPSR